jgi:SAM-dependent methyltransferase
MGQTRRGATGASLGLTGERTTPGVEAENYWFRRHEAAYRFAAGRVRGPVLDAGSGEGYGAAMLAATGVSVIAAELDGPAAQHAASTYPAIRVIRADACRLPFKPGAFGGVLAMQVLEHLWCPEDFVVAVRDLLLPGGSLVLTTPNRSTFSPDGVRNPFHAHEYTAEELRALLGRSFRNVELLGVRPGLYLRSLDVLAEGSLQHLLMRTPYEELPSKLRTGIGMVRPGHFTVGEAEGSLDLLAIAS